MSTILQACSKLLIEEGFYGVTTDKVAKEAGVSIGSLYQFFGNKESVVSAVIREVLNNDILKFKAAVANTASLNQKQKINLIIHTLIQNHSSSLELRTKIQSIQNYLLDRQFFQDHIQSYCDIIEKVLTPMENRNIKNVAFILTNSLLGLLNNAFEHNSHFHENTALIKEMELLFESYLSV